MREAGRSLLEGACQIHRTALKKGSKHMGVPQAHFWLQLFQIVSLDFKPLTLLSITWCSVAQEMLSWKGMKPSNKTAINALTIISKLFSIIHFALTTSLKKSVSSFLCIFFFFSKYLLNASARCFAGHWKTSRNKTQFLRWGPHSFVGGKKWGSSK